MAASERMNWTEEELNLIISDYFLMLDEESGGIPYNKAQHNRLLQDKIDRSKGSIEFKHQNISAVLHQLGLDPHRMEIPGRKRLEIDYGQPITEIIA